MQNDYTWKGDDHPPEWARIGTVDVADTADMARALDRGYRIGMVYDGGSDSCAEPCAADIYIRRKPSEPDAS